MPLDLEALATLEAVVAEGGIARAAQRLHKVPSAVSYQVSKLEQYLETPLLNREGYRVKLTPAGEIILSEGRNLLGRAREVEALAKQFREGWEARLQLIVDREAKPLADILAGLRQRHVVQVLADVEVGHVLPVRERLGHVLQDGRPRARAAPPGVGTGSAGLEELDRREGFTVTRT